MKTCRHLHAVLAFALCSIQQSQAQFHTDLTNGSFESGFTDWTASGNVVIETSGSPAAAYAPTDGTKLAAFNAANSAPNGVLRRTLTVPNTISRTHRLRFDVGNLGYVAHEMKLNVKVIEHIYGTDQVRVNADLAVPGTTGGATNWIAAEYTFPSPLTGSVDLVFTDVSPVSEYADMVLDHVRVDDSRHVSIHSSNDYPNPGVSVTVAPADIANRGNGTTSFNRSYYAGEAIHLTAAATTGSGQAFSEWTKDGAHFSSNPSITFPMEEDVTMKAVYGAGISFSNTDSWDVRGFIGTGPFTPLVRSGSFRNESSSDITWSATLDPAQASWLEIWPKGGTLAPDNLQLFQFSVTTAALDLGAGKHEGHVRFTTPSGSVDIPVSIIVLDPDHVVLNGTFSDGFNGWTTSGNVVVEGAPPPFPPDQIDGKEFVAFNSVNSTPNGVLAQTLHTEAGVRYSLDFYAGTVAFRVSEQRLGIRARDALDAGSPALLDTVYSVFGSGGGGAASLSWTLRHYEFVATSALTTLSFIDESPDTTDADLLLDHVRVSNPAYHLTATIWQDENDATMGGGIGDSLREVLAEAARRPGGNLIRFSSASGTVLDYGPLLIDSEVGIDAMGKTITISGGGSSAVFGASAPASIRNLVIDHGSDSGIRNSSDLMLIDTEVTGNATPDAGGGIRNNGSLLADHCSIHGNTSTSQGGGVANFGNASITDTTIDGNSTTGTGGGLSCSGAFGGSWIILRDSTVSRNHADVFGGGYGGTSGYKSWGNLKAVNSTFSGNTAVRGGGGIFGNLAVELNHCTVSANSCSASNGAGGGIRDSQQLVLENSIVAGNLAATDADLSNSVLLQTGANLIGGNPKLAELYDNGGKTATMALQSDSTAVDAAIATPNSPTTDQRGHARPSGPSADLGAVELLETVVDTLVDEDDGVMTGGVSLRDAINKQAYSPVDAIRFSPALNGGTIHLTHGYITAFAGNIPLPPIIDATSLPDGITISGDHLSSVFNFVFVSGAIHGLTIADSSGSAIYSFVSSIWFRNCIFRNNSTTGDGGVLHNSHYNGFAGFTRCLFENNLAGGRGGAVYNEAGTDITGSTFSNNHAGTGGGAVSCGPYRYALNISNSTFTNNSTGGGGGAIETDCLTLIHSTVVGNHAATSGGGILSPIAIPPTIETPERGLRISNSIIAANTASTGSDLSGEIATQLGNNLIGGNPILAPLADYGGPTPTMPPLPGSGAIEAAVLLDTTPPADQRGMPRPYGIAPDIGAVEAFPFSSLALIDSDNDGIDDRLEPAYQMTVGQNDGATDTDGDGSTDAEEIANMTDPNDPNSLLRVLSISSLPGYHRFRLLFTSFPGLSYTMECDQDLDFQGTKARVFPLGTAGSTTGQVDVDLLPGRDFVRIRRDP